MLCCYGKMKILSCWLHKHQTGIDLWKYTSAIQFLFHVAMCPIISLVMELKIEIFVSDLG